MKYLLLKIFVLFFSLSLFSQNSEETFYINFKLVQDEENPKLYHAFHVANETLHIPLVPGGGVFSVVVPNHVNFVKDAYKNNFEHADAQWNYYIVKPFDLPDNDVSSNKYKFNKVLGDNNIYYFYTQLEVGDYFYEEGKDVKLFSFEIDKECSSGEVFLMEEDDNAELNQACRNIGIGTHSASVLLPNRNFPVNRYLSNVPGFDSYNCGDDNLISAVDDKASTNQGVDLSINVLSNDTFEGDVLVSVTKDIDSSIGLLEVDENNKIKFTPNDQFSGETSFKYEVCALNDKDNCSEAKVDVVVNEILPIPEAVKDSFVTESSEEIIANVLDNDKNTENVSISLVSGTLNGILDFDTDTGKFSYVSKEDFIGQDSFVYKLCNSNNACSSTTVTITVNEPYNHKLLAREDYYNTEINKELVMNILANDKYQYLDKISVKISKNIQKDKGELRVNDDKTVTYIPAEDFTGRFNYKYTLCESEGSNNCMETTVYVKVFDTVIAENDEYEVDYNKIKLLKVLRNDLYPEDRVISIVKSVESNHGTINQYDNKYFEFVPKEGFVGETSFTYELCAFEGSDNCDTAVVTLSVLGDEILEERIAGSYFEVGWDIWSSGGHFATREQGQEAYEGEYSIRLNDSCGIEKHGAMTTNVMDLRYYDEVEISFYMLSKDLEEGDQFALRFKQNGNWVTVKNYKAFEDFENDKYYKVTAVLNSVDYDFGLKSRFRIQNYSLGEDDYIYIDQTEIIGRKLAKDDEWESTTDIEFIEAFGGAMSEQNVNDDRIMLYPVPFTDNLNFGITKGLQSEFLNYTVYDIYGRSVLKGKIKSTQSIRTDSLPDGVYYVEILIDNEIFRKKVMKK